MKTNYWLIVLSVLTACSTNKEWVDVGKSITESLHDIEIIDDETAIAYSYGTGNIYKTQNGGTSWKHIHQFDSIYFEQIQCLDDKNAWIAGSPNKIYSTQNGGKDWTDKSLEEQMKNALIYGMYFETANMGYIAAIERAKKGFSTKIYKTENGGDAWKVVNQVDEMILNLEKIGGTLYGTGSNCIIKHIADKENWTYSLKDTSKQVGQIRDLAQNESGKIYATSFGGYIIDVGKSEQHTSWQKITDNRIRNLIAIDKNTWLAVGDSNKKAGNRWMSKDNGTSWTTMDKSLADVHRIEKSNRKLWMVGKDGLVMTRKK